MPQPKLARLQRHAGKAYQRFEKNLDKVRRLIPANDDLVETQFLPAALELVETPPSPAGRGLIYLICAFFVIALGWSFFGKVDLVATASGHVIPSGKVKVIQPLEIGVVSKIDVTDGQHVRKGDLLIEIDPTGSKAEALRLAQELAENRVEAARLSIMAKAVGPGEDADKAFRDAVPKDADPALVERQRALLHSALSEQAAVLAGIDSNSAQKKAEHDQAATEIAKLSATVPLIRKRSQMRQTLIKEGYTSQMEASREQQSLIESEKALIEDKQKLVQTAAAIAQLAAQRQEAVAKFLSSTLTSLADAERKANDSEQQLIKARDLENHRILTSPVDGVVQQLAVHTVGGVVTPAQELMVVVPNGAVLEIEAMIQNKDIGFVREGQLAEIKVETFPFTRYGLRHGKILEVSHDAVASPPQAQNKPKNDSSDTASGQSQESLYMARINLDQDTMQVDDKSVQLVPGMTVTAEIKTGRQRIIDYLFDPLRRYHHDSFQER